MSKLEFFLAGTNFSILEKYRDKRMSKGKSCTLNVLFSFYYEKSKVIKSIVENRSLVEKTMLDSGGFTAFKISREEQIKLYRRYKNFLKKRTEDVDSMFDGRVIALDVEKGFEPESFRRNFRYCSELKKVFNNIVPVIHNIQETSAEVREYGRLHPNWMSIGQYENRDEAFNRKDLQNTVEQIKKQRNANYQPCKCHLLGCSSYEVLKDLPLLDSYDSKSWLDYARFGIVEYFDVEFGKEPVDKHFYWPEFVKEEEIKTYYEHDEIKILNEIKKVKFDFVESDYKKKFYNEMFAELGLNSTDFVNDNNLETRQLANIYYEMKKNAYLNQQRNKVV